MRLLQLSLCSDRDYKEYHTDTTVKFVIQMSKEALRKAETEGLHKVFKLQTLLSINSMVRKTLLLPSLSVIDILGSHPISEIFFLPEHPI